MADNHTNKGTQNFILQSNFKIDIFVDYERIYLEMTKPWRHLSFGGT